MKQFIFKVKYHKEYCIKINSNDQKEAVDKLRDGKWIIKAKGKELDIQEITLKRD
ncbi:MAG TPA: hypothetical protein PLE33_05930 [Candidatus Cloacimonas sp.]|nr:hypothetical protein [Candidatus Cloacimonas sp.]HPS60784.1 hypothetical protein [Candidatus Cloacimonas sp.]